MMVTFSLQSLATLHGVGDSLTRARGGFVTDAAYSVARKMALFVRRLNFVVKY